MSTLIRGWPSLGPRSLALPADPAQAAVLLLQRAPDHDHVTGREFVVGDGSVREAGIGQDRVVAGILQVLIH